MFNVAKFMDEKAQYEPIDDNGDQPVSRAEFNDAMRSVARSLENVATKEDLKQFATKDDLQTFQEQTNDRIATLATKAELTAMEERLSAQIKANGETIVKALSRHIDTAVEDAVDQKVAPLEKRVSRLEENAGLSPAG